MNSWGCYNQNLMNSVKSKKQVFGYLICIDVPVVLLTHFPICPQSMHFLLIFMMAINRLKCSKERRERKMWPRQFECVVENAWPLLNVTKLSINVFRARKSWPKFWPDPDPAFGSGSNLKKPGQKKHVLLCLYYLFVTNRIKNLDNLMNSINVHKKINNEHKYKNN